MRIVIVTCHIVYRILLFFLDETIDAKAIFLLSFNGDYLRRFLFCSSNQYAPIQSSHYIPNSWKVWQTDRDLWVPHPEIAFWMFQWLKFVDITCQLKSLVTLCNLQCKIK